MKISINSEQLIQDVLEDIDLFGASFTVYAVYALQVVGGQEFEYINSYVDAERPTSEEIATQEDYDDVVEDYDTNIAKLKDTKHELMTLADLLVKLIEQDSVL